MSDRIRTALFGGTFNPPHNGHLAIAGSVMEQGLADEFRFLITPCNPWKKNQKIPDNQLRFKMVSEAIQGMSGVFASDYEFNLPVPSYTAYTLRRLSADYPDREFILTIGADNWAKFSDWRDSDYILNNYRIIVYPRKGCTIGQPPPTVTLLDMPLIDISSTDIRNRIHKGEPIDQFVPVSVARFIADKGLYTR